MKRIITLLVVATCVVSCTILGFSPPGRAQQGTLDIYFLDMMGGGSTLIVTPLGESVLIDTGSLEPKHRDADRMFQAAQYAGLTQIDHLVTTHFHSDHFGGILQLSKVIPIKKFYDKGFLPPEKDTDTFTKLYPFYREATKGQIIKVKAGDDIPLKSGGNKRALDLRLHCVAAEKVVEGFGGNVDTPVSGQEIKKADTSDNGRSIALVLRYGDFDFFAGGDITWNVEHHLAHPQNRIGEIDLYQVTHHGLDQSNNPILMKALNPTVCVAMNGPRKGIQPRTFRALNEIPGVQAIYQIHYNTRNGDSGNTRPEFIANMDDPKKGELIKVSVNPAKGVYGVSIGVDGPKRFYEIK